MGILLPQDYDTRIIDDPTERRVVEDLRDRLSDSWYIIPRLDIATRKRPYEVDVLLFHRDYGIAGIEVKGGYLEVREGEWYRGKKHLEPGPPRQAQDACYELRNLLRESKPSLKHVHVQQAVAMPDCDCPTTLPLDVLREQILSRSDLERIPEWIEGLMLLKAGNQLLSDEQINDFLDVVRPNISFRWDAEAQARDARFALDRIMRDQIEALATLDMNPIVFVHGAAGTGKTQLAIRWAYRAAMRAERTMVTCFNVPLGDHLQHRTREIDNLWSGDFGEIVLNLPGLPPMDEPEKRDELWYRLAVRDHIATHLDKITVRFDTIIVDEAQDFYAEWIEIMSMLLDPAGPRRLLFTGDAHQNLYRREALAHIMAMLPAQARLTTNCRNTQQIGRVLRGLGGAKIATSSPDGQGVYWIDAEDETSLLRALEVELEDLIGSRSIHPANVLIATTSRRLRDLIIAADPGHYDCTSWEDRGSDNIVCETIHRSKGLEFDAVVVVVHSEDVVDDLLYVGASRAISILTIIGPPAVGQRLGIA